MLFRSAGILEHHLGDAGNARELYEQVLAEDPSHAAASEGLARLYEQSGDTASLVRILEGRAESLRGSDRHRAQCRIAEAYENKLGDFAGAIERLQQVLAEDPADLEALRSLDRLYTKTSRYQELRANLEKQIHLAETPRQQIALLERLAALHEEEFLDYAKAASTMEQVLDLDRESASALESLARYYRVLERWGDVAIVLERALEITTEPRRQLSLALQLGRVLSEHVAAPERAIHAFERALAIDPDDAQALEALARLRESSGDADAALDAIEALAQSASSPEGRAEQYLRAAKLLVESGDLDGAIERFKLALDANPQDPQLSIELRRAYVARGDVNAAIQLLERDLERTEGERAKAKLAGEIALLAHRNLKNDAKAEDAAKRALALDPTNIDGLLVMGDLAFEGERFLEASRYYSSLADRAEALDREIATEMLIRYVDALARNGSTERALAAMDTLLRIAPDNQQAVLRVAQVTYEAGTPERSIELHEQLLRHFATELADRDRARVLHRYGDSLRKVGRFAEAIARLEESVDLDPTVTAPLTALANVYADQGQWEHVLKVKSRHLDLAGGEDRVQLLMEMGDISASKLGNRAQAIQDYSAALDERPDDRRVLTKLMQLYTEERDWNRLVDVILRLAEFLDDSLQKSKYLNSAAKVLARELGDTDRALALWDQVIDLDPSNAKAFSDSIQIQRDRGNFSGVEQLLLRRLATLGESDKTTRIEVQRALGELYERQLGDRDRAIAAYEQALELLGDDASLRAHLAGLYVEAPEQYFAQAVEAHGALLRADLGRTDSLRALRKLYTDVKRADASWCLCQALTVLGRAEPDEERFFRRMRSETAAPAQAVLTDEDWIKALVHPRLDPFLTGIFALIEPAVYATRAQKLEELGFDPGAALDLSQHPLPMPQTLYYAAGVLGMPAPLAFDHRQDPGGLAFVPSNPAAIALGRQALLSDVPPQVAAFVAARHLAFYKPGLSMRMFAPTGTALKSWLFAAIKLISPQFPVAPDIEGAVAEAYRALDANVRGAARDELTRVVSKLLQAGAPLDLKKWQGAVDLTADRLGLLLAHDLETAVAIVDASDEAAAAVPKAERRNEMVLFAVSAPYLDLRRSLGIAIDS